MTINIEDLKTLYIGKEFGFLTVLDVVRRGGCIFFDCECKCGKLHSAYYIKVLRGSTKSCGCYKFSKERADKYKEWCKNNPDKVIEKSNKYKKWCKEHPDKLAEQGKRHSQWFKDNPEKVDETSKKIAEWYKNNPEKLKERAAKRAETLKNNPDIMCDVSIKLSNYYRDNPDKLAAFRDSYINYSNEIRQLADYSDLLNVVHEDYIEDLLNGNIKASTIIKTKCPICGEYAEHKFNNVYRVHDGKFKNSAAPVCLKCKCLITCSSAETEIANYISTFYNGEYIRNNRDIISPLELDLYYTEKKIAIEFNGDYWHSDKFKDKDYHYNKFKQCYDKGITLVSIFESAWNDNKVAIKEYLSDLFKGIENKLSFVGNDYINNNYPLPVKYAIDNYECNFYKYGNISVYTCGLSKYNSGGSLDEDLNEIVPGMKRVFLGSLEDPFILKNNSDDNNM